jgi:hypothetical protein
MLLLLLLLLSGYKICVKTTAMSRNEMNTCILSVSTWIINTRWQYTDSEWIIQALPYLRRITIRTAAETYIDEGKLYRTRHVWRQTNTGITLMFAGYYDVGVWIYRQMARQSSDMNIEGRAAVSTLQMLIMYTLCPWSTLYVGLLHSDSCCCVPPLHCCHVQLSILERHWLRICL